MKKLILASVALSMLSVGHAQAADAPFVDPAYDWSGFYVGIQGGYGWGDYDVALEIPPHNGFPSDGADFGGEFDDDFLGGIHAGYNFMATENFVFGLEADIETTGFNGDQDPSTDHFKMKIPVMGSLRARAGYSLDNLLIYGTGGLAIAAGDFDTEIQNTFADNKETFVGFTVGAGVNWGITEHLSAGLEYRYTDLGSVDYTPSVLECFDQISQIACNISGDLSFHAVRASLSYRF
ncbi:MAG: outer membrane protein [Aestuariivirga sp.]